MKREIEEGIGRKIGMRKDKKREGERERREIEE